MNRASAISGMAEGALRLFHFRSHGVQVVGNRNHREKQNQRATENANKYEWMARRRRHGPAAPQHKAGNQQREPTKIKKKLHTNRWTLLQKY